MLLISLVSCIKYLKDELINPVGLLVRWHAYFFLFVPRPRQLGRLLRKQHPAVAYRHSLLTVP